MGKVARVTISLSAEILEAIERKRSLRQQTRSEFVRDAVERALREDQEEQDIRQYIEAYRRLPETDEEILAAHQTARAILAQEPWE